MTARATATQGRARLDRTAVVGAARELLDAEGVVGFSMARLGERLGVTAMALYRHVTGRGDLEHAVLEHVLAELSSAAVPNGSWADGVADWMHDVRRSWIAHPWLGTMLGTRSELSPAWLATIDRLTGVLERAGLPPDVVARELVHISRTTIGVLTLEVAAPLPHPGLTGAAIAGLPAPTRARWRAIATSLRRYDNDALFADVVAATIARLRAVGGGR